MRAELEKSREDTERNYELERGEFKDHISDLQISLDKSKVNPAVDAPFAEIKYGIYS